MQSRGWKQASSPRVSDEQVGLQREKWEETELELSPTTHSEGAEDGLHDARRRLSETNGETNPAATARKDWSAVDDVTSNKETGERKLDVEGPESDCNSDESERMKSWDVHWSQTKWAVKTMRFARKLAPWQKVNHFRNSKELCRKASSTTTADTATADGECSVTLL